jgi:magnesium transporter
MMRILHRRGNGTLDVTLAADGIASALADPRGLLWVDFRDEPRETCEPILRDTFGFHPLAIDDAIAESHVPKIDDWDSYLYLVLHAVNLQPNGTEPLSTRELDVFIGRNYVVTLHDQPIEPLDRVWSTCLRDERAAARGAAHLLYHVIDEVVAGHMPLVDGIDERMEGIEEQILARATPAALQQVLTMKRALMHLRRIIAPQREVLNKLARDGFAVIEPDARVYFRDVYDHLVRLYDITEGMRDLAAGALDTYLSVINNRMNEVMKTFTLITTLFMPISFITGFFGMNFFQPAASPPGWTGKIVFWAVCAVIVAIPVLMYLWLRKRKWV